MTLYLLNAPVATNFGLFRYSQITVENAVWLMEQRPYISAIGHESTAELFSLVTGKEVKPNRIQVKMMPMDDAIVFQLNTRQPEGVVISSIEELNRIGYSFGLLTMLEEDS